MSIPRLLKIAAAWRTGRRGSPNSVAEWKTASPSKKKPHGVKTMSRLRSCFPRLDGKQRPADQEKHAPERGNRTQHLDVGQAEGIETAGKQDNAEKEAPACPGQCGGTGEKLDEQGNRDQGESMCGLVGNAGLKDAQQILIQLLLQAMGCKRAECNGQKTVDRAKQ